MEENTPIRLLVIDDNQFFRKALRTALHADSRIELVGTASNGESALMMVRSLQPEIVLLDLHMPIMDGFIFTEQINQLPGISPRILVITADSSQRAIQRAFEIGVSGYILKDNVTEDNIISAACAVADGGIFIDPQALDRLLKSQTIQSEFRTIVEGLNFLDSQLLCCIAHGHDNKEIATELNISTKTVSNRLSLLYLKLSVKNRVQAANYAYRSGVVPLLDVSPRGKCCAYESCPKMLKT